MRVTTNQLSFDDILQAAPLPRAAAPSLKKPRAAKKPNGMPLPPPAKLPQHPTHFRASNGVWYPIHTTFYCGSHLYASVDMCVNGRCALPDCTLPFGEHWHTIGTDRPELFKEVKEDTTHAST